MSSEMKGRGQEDEQFEGEAFEREPFERQDLSPRAVLGFLIGLAVMCVVVAVILKGVYWGLDRYNEEHQPPQSPLAGASASPEQRRDLPRPAKNDAVRSIFPEPRLENDERNELKSVRAGEAERLNSYGWVDEKTGVAHIPIERAMQLIAERGLPVNPRAGVAPPSAVNMAREAAVKSDTSRMAPKPQEKKK